jgi:hypothetical protein
MAGGQLVADGCWLIVSAGCIEAGLWLDIVGCS